MYPNGGIMTNRTQQREYIAKSSLEAKTLLYWQVGLAKNRAIGPLAGCATEKAIGLLSDLEIATSYSSPLGEQVTDMLDDIIGRPKKKNRKAFAKALDRKPTKKISSRDWDDDDGPRAA